MGRQLPRRLESLLHKMHGSETKERTGNPQKKVCNIFVDIKP